MAIQQLNHEILQQRNSVVGWLVYLSINGAPITLAFPTEPTESELTTRIAETEQRIADELAAAELEANMAEVLE